MKSKETPSAAKSDKPFPIVGIGASAGGLEALESFLTILPKKFGVAIIFIQHLSPKHKNLLPELLRSRTTDLQIDEIEDGLKILPGRLYLCPPAKEIRIQKGIFRISSHIHQHVHLPIDEFFASLAEDVVERAIVVILSGAGTDGARGVQAVRSAGGTVFVQDPATAEFPAMPLAAINTGQMDEVLPPQDIAREILRLHGSGIGSASPETFANRLQFEPFYRLIYEKTGYRFNHYKQSVVARRIKRRMSLLGASAVKDYLNIVESKDSEAALLASDLMIGVTSFFRDRLAWKALHLDVTRKIVAQDDDSPVRVWTPACATGEEPYSIAMMLQQELDLAARKREIQVFATDVNDRALERAREGIYPASIAADVPADYMKKFFTSSENGLSVTVNKEIRQHIVFAKHDLLTDPPFSRLDLVICRNLLIYLEADAQEKCISLFHYALKEGGSLFLGGAESPGRNSALFSPLPHKKCRVYRKAETKRSVRTPLSVPYAAERSTSSLPIKQASTTEYRQSAIQAIQEALLEEHAPAAVAIDQHYEILYHNGPTSRYLRQPRGTPTQNLLELLPKNLRNRLRGGLYRAAEEGKPISVRTSISGENEQKKHVTFRVSKVRDDLFLIIFEEKGVLPEQKEATLLEAAAVEETAVHQLENELSATREDLQSHIEQLKSLNEELHSSNEELQAANEELETSREELQSLNEELITVNTQLQTKIEEEEETNNDLSNFLASANIPTIFLNQQFRLKRFTSAMSRLIKLIPGDVGRPIIDMSQEHLGPDLIADASAVLDQLTPIKKELAINGAWYVRTTLPYRTADNRIEGVVVTYVDISEIKQAEEALQKATERERFLAHVLETAVVPFGIGAPDGSLLLFNRAFAELTGYTKEELEEKGVTWAVDLTPPEWRQREAAILDEARRTRQPARYEKEYLRKNGSRVPIELSVEPVFDDAGNLKHYYSFLTDITERKRAEEALRESEQRVRLKLESILSPEGDIGDLELADIIDAPAIQLLMDDFHQLAQLPMAIIDLKGKVLVGAGWQDICTKFHRAHPETCKHCIESDTLLSAGIPPGESRLYKCKNNMWDIATPIMVGGHHVGNIFSGQFFFEGELLDYELFRSQAKQYGFNEEEYIAALEAVPRLSKESVGTGMAFFMKLAQTLSQLSYSNIKLARSLAQRDALMEDLRESEERFRALFENAADAMMVTDPEGEGRILSVNPSACKMFGYSEEEFLQLDRQALFDTSDPDLAALLEEREKTGQAVSSLTYRRKDGTHFTGDLSTATFYDKSGNRRAVAVIRDITERKRAEEAMRRLAQFPEQNPSPVLRIALDGTLLYANPPARVMLEAMAAATNEALPQPILALVAEAAQQAHAVEAELADSRGRTFWFGAAQPAGEEYVNLYARDITERKRAENVVQTTLQRFYTVLSSMYAGLLLMTDEGRVEFANQVFCDLFGLNDSPAELVRLASHEILGKIGKAYRHPDQAIARIREITDRGEPVKGEEVAMQGGRALLRDFIPIRVNGKSYGRLWYHTDITELKHAEEALRESEERFRNMFERHNAVMLLVEPETGEVVDANPAAAEYYGYSRDQLRTMQIQEINQLPSEQVAAELEKTAAEQRGHFVFPHRLADGRVRWVDVYSSRFETQGKAMLFSVIHDITERRQAEEALEKNMERLDIISSTASRLLLSAEPQKIVEALCRRVMEHLDCHAFFNFLVDEERNCLRLNAYAGIPDETAREIHFLDFGVAVCGCAARDACRIVAENIPTTPDIRTELVRSFGIKAYACHPLFAQGRVIGTLSFGTKSRLIFTDDELSLMKTVADQVATAMERVRLLQSAEERAEELGQLVEERTAALQLANVYHRSLIETSLDPLVTISPEGMITDVNTATERVTGYSRDVLVGTDFSGYFTDPERAMAGYRRVFKDGLIRDYELAIRHRDGHVTPVLYNASVYRDGAGQVVGAFAAARDITEHKQMDEQLRQAHKMEAIGTLAGGIAHDFNNILAIIIGNAELAIDEVSEEIGAHHNLEQIFKAGMRGRNLVRQILTFSRKTEHERKPLPLAPLVQETFDLLRASLPTTIGITLNLKTSDDVALADATQIQQVLMNLCKNAADAMRATGGSLEVSLAETIFTDGTPLPESDMEPGAYVTLTVSDTGHGMDEEVQKKLFEPFFTTKEKGQGTGMGLAVVYGIVKAHHGAITVSSKPGQGSAFIVYLPQYMSDEKPEQKTRSTTPGGKERVLFVDDEEPLVELGEYMLQRLGYRVVGKTDSMDALKTFAEHPETFDLVITDQTMPQMTGAILARKLKEIRPDIPVILCTGYSETISPEEAESMGIQAFVMKPLSKDEAAETIRRVLDRSHAN